MSLFVGTREGLYETPESAFDSPERALDCGYTHRLRTFPDDPGLFVASHEGLYYTETGGDWERIDTPVREVWEVLLVEDELFVGTSPAALYRSSDRGDTWSELTALQDVPGRDRWRSAPSPRARIRTLQRAAGDLEQLLVGVEAGGVFVSTDGGASWEPRDVQGQTDIHQIVPLAEDEFIVVCGRLSTTNLNHAANVGGLYHTDDGGDTFNRISDAVEPYYFRQVLYLDGRLYAGGSFTIPPVWILGGSGDGRLFESPDLVHFEEVAYPGGPEEVILSWGVAGGTPVAGTAAGGLRGSPSGRVLRREGRGEWRSLGTVPNHVHAITAF